MDLQEVQQYLQQLKNKKTRTKAASNLIRNLQGLLHAKEEEQEIIETKFGNVNKIVSYTLMRLIKGSTVKSIDTQLGFALPIRSIMATFKDIQTDLCIKYIFDYCHPKNALKKSEISHFLLGRYFCLQQVLNARGHQVNLRSCLTLMFNDIQRFSWTYSQVSQIILSQLQNQNLSVTILENAFLEFYQKSKKMIEKIRNILSIFLIIIILENKKQNKELHPKILNIKNKILVQQKDFVNMLVQTIEEYPQTSFFVIQFCKFIATFNQTQLNDFWQNVPRQIRKKNKSHKGIFIVLTLMENYIRNNQYFMLCLTPELVKLWSNNLNSHNKKLKNLARLIEKTLSNKIQNFESNEEFEVKLVNLVVQLKEQRFAFTKKIRISRSIYTKLSKKKIKGIAKYLLTQFEEQKELLDKQYFLQELLTIFEQTFNGQKLGDKYSNKILMTFFNVLKQINLEKDSQADLAPEQKRYLNFNTHCLSNLIHYLMICRADQRSKSQILQGLDNTFQPWIVRVVRLLQTNTESLNKNVQDQLLQATQALELLSNEFQFEEPKQENVNLSRRLLLQKLISLVFIYSCFYNDNEDVNQIFDDLLQFILSWSDEKKKNDNELFLIFNDILIQLLSDSPGYIKNIVPRVYEQFCALFPPECFEQLMSVITKKDREFIFEDNQQGIDKQNDQLKNNLLTKENSSKIEEEVINS